MGAGWRVLRLPAAPPPLPGAARGASSLRPGGARGGGPSFGRPPPRTLGNSAQTKAPVGIRPRPRFSGRPLFSPKIATLQVRRVSPPTAPSARSRASPRDLGEVSQAACEAGSPGRRTEVPGGSAVPKAPLRGFSLRLARVSARRSAVDGC